STSLYNRSGYLYMETVMKFLRREIVGALGAAFSSAKTAITILIFLSLIAVNIATLVSSAVHDFLYLGLSSIPIAKMTELLANSPTERHRARTAQLSKENAAMKQRVKSTTSSIKRRTVRTV